MIGHRKYFALCLLICSILFTTQTTFAHSSKTQTSQTFLAEKFYRTELYFGTDITGGGKVSEADWNKFLADEVTSRFPDGLTVLEGYGQFKDSNGKIVREESKVLILLYPKKARNSVNQKIEEIRTAYKKQFQQESVLRLDFRQTVQISF